MFLHDDCLQELSRPCRCSPRDKWSSIASDMFDVLSNNVAGLDDKIAELDGEIAELDGKVV